MGLSRKFWVLLRSAVLFLALLVPHGAQNTAVNKDLTCHDPDLGGDVQNNDRRFIIIGSDSAVGAGMGNILIFFPAAYYFAMFTGRDILIADGSVVGEMCRVIHCGFPMVSEMALAYPGILTEENINNAPSLKKGEMMTHMEGSRPQNDLVVRAGGYMPSGDWWVYFVQCVACVTKVTGCETGDITCAERHAFQHLIRGPFKESLEAAEEARIHGVQKNVKHALLSLPHAYAPRFDVAIHLRTQFHSFENQLSSNSSESKKEVNEWLNGEEGKEVFRLMEEELLNQLKKDHTHRDKASEHHGIISATSYDRNAPNPPQVEKSLNGTTIKKRKAGDPIYVYLAADNEDVKEAFAKKLEEKHEVMHHEIKVMRIKTKGIIHVKNLKKMKDMTNNEGILDLVFDWYALSLTNVVLAWRKGSTHMVSTFVQSAARVSGTNQRSVIHRALGKGGVGTFGFQLQRNKQGNYFWNHMWIYGFLEDYAKPTDNQRRRMVAEGSWARTSNGYSVDNPWQRGGAPFSL